MSLSGRCRSGERSSSPVMERILLKTSGKYVGRRALLLPFAMGKTVRTRVARLVARRVGFRAGGVMGNSVIAQLPL
jgi:hypothetical protein